jgi:hypothetical protein
LIKDVTDVTYLPGHVWDLLRAFDFRYQGPRDAPSKEMRRRSRRLERLPQQIGQRLDSTLDAFMDEHIIQTYGRSAYQSLQGRLKDSSK